MTDNNRGAWDVWDEQSSRAKLQFKFVADDGTETLLQSTEFGTSAYSNIEKDLFYIPPKAGTLWYRYVDFCVAANSDIRKDGDWAGGIAITHGYIISGSKDDAQEIARGNNPSPSVPMAAMGNSNWDIDTHFAELELQREADRIRFQRLANEINPLRKKMGAELYPEDFYSETLTNRQHRNYFLDPNHAPQWALDGEATLKAFFTEYEIATVMTGILSAVEKRRGYRQGDLSQTRQLSAPGADSSQQRVDEYNKWLDSETKRKNILAKRRAEIAAKRAETVEETSWEWEQRLNEELAAAKLLGDQAEIERLEAEIAAGYSFVATQPAQQPQEQQGQQSQQNQQQKQQVQGSQTIEDTPKRRHHPFTFRSRACSTN